MITKDSNSLVQYKTCTVCIIAKPLTEFYNEKHGKYGKRSKCIHCHAKERSLYYKNNKTYHLNKTREYGIKHKDHLNEVRRLKYDHDKNYRLKVRLRARFGAVVDHKYKSASVIRLIGCTLDYFNKYIETKFSDGMSWSNYDEWHYDHIIPCDYFDLTLKSEQEKCFHWSNFQPLWKHDNHSKGSILPEDFQERKWITGSGWTIS
jgi:hypothetical protein